MAKDSSVVAAEMHNEEDADEYRRTMACPSAGQSTGTRDADEAAPMGTQKTVGAVGISTWRAGCGESRTSGSEGVAPWKAHGVQQPEMVAAVKPSQQAAYRVLRGVR